ncbi:hypothetical protein EVAR_29019_1 [Eumeta japonica]|uniref:Uncharacterized protein n=1 Tax=Eumeta variegata TaxID=151549 RepID=A0A4C1W2H7_EUMVA|nr:hypothetical protein EVAR_29019_1 [Eumeta japonica]
MGIEIARELLLTYRLPIAVMRPLCRLSGTTIRLGFRSVSALYDHVMQITVIWRRSGVRARRRGRSRCYGPRSLSRRALTVQRNVLPFTHRDGAAAPDTAPRRRPAVSVKPMREQSTS